MSASGSIRLIVLDFDGVILESNHAKTEAFRELFATFPGHADAMMAYHHAHVSLSRYGKFRHLVFERLARPGDEAMVMALAADYEARVRQRIDRCALVPGAAELLDEFHGRVPLFLASVTPEPELLGILERRGLRRCFDGVFGDPPVPKAEAVARVLSSTGVAATDAALVGDSPGDLGVAQATGVAFIGRDSGIPFPAPAPPLHRDLFGVAAALRPLIP